MESLSLIICIILTIFIFLCLFLLILHQRTTNSRTVRPSYVNSSTRLIKCINLCNQLCNTNEKPHTHDFEANGNVHHQSDVLNRINNPTTVNDVSCSPPTRNHHFHKNNLTYETCNIIGNHGIVCKLVNNETNANICGMYSQSSIITDDPDPINTVLMKSRANHISKNPFIHQASDSSFNCSYFDEISNPFNEIDNSAESSHVNSLLDKIPQHRRIQQFSSNHSRRLDYKNSRTKMLTMKYKNYLNRIKQTSKYHELHSKLHGISDMQTIECVPQRDLVNADHESPWVKANKTINSNSSTTGQSNQSSCSSNQDDILLSICPKARDPTNILADLHVPLHKIIFNRVVLQGTFSQLYEGKLLISFRKHGIYTSKWKQVLIKTLTEKATTEQIRLFQNDACKFVGAKHQQVASIIAASSTSICVSCSLSDQQIIINRPILIYADAKYGNLKLFLQRRSNGLQCGNMKSNIILTAAQLINMGLQILSAAEYLHSINVIHEDIATRNCLLKCRTCVALSDSALSKDLFPEDYHCLGDNTNRPVKWLALEALVERKYTMATDVWSVGVTLWELITRGQQPYASIDAFEMTTALRTGYRLKKPHNCPDDLWKIIFACWKTNPSTRPTIRQLIAKLKAFKVAVTNYI
ncbi:unnamed protein product [Schistosoma turkestanicum]|nr:unnamed protein product [Schistosoma turkestanicum]